MTVGWSKVRDGGGVAYRTSSDKVRVCTPQVQGGLWLLALSLVWAWLNSTTQRWVERTLAWGGVEWGGVGWGEVG